MHNNIAKNGRNWSFASTDLTIATTVINWGEKVSPVWDANPRPPQHLFGALPIKHCFNTRNGYWNKI